MSKKFLTKENRLENLKKRSQLIKESFQKEFNKIKRIDEAHILDNANIIDFVNWFDKNINVFNEKHQSYGSSHLLEDEVIKLLYTIGQKLDIEPKSLRRFLPELKNKYLTSTYESDEEITRGVISLFDYEIIKYSSYSDGYSFTAETLDYKNLEQAIKKYIEILSANN